MTPIYRKAIAAFLFGAVLISTLLILTREEPEIHKNSGESRAGVMARAPSVEREVNNAAWSYAAMPSGAYSKMDPAEFAKIPLPRSGHPSFDRANFLIFCQDYINSVDALQNPIAELTAQMPNNPSVESFIFMREVQRIRCKDIKKDEYEKIEALMNEAAEAGDPGARTYLGSKILLADLKTSESSTGTIEKRPTPAEVKTAAEQMLELAMTGNRLAVSQAYIVTSTDRYGLNDPIAAAAWKMVMFQRPDASSFDMDIPDVQLPETMSESDKSKAVARAREYFNLCCRRLDTLSGQVQSSK
ncbi:hypothetical protein [Acidovorax sp. LjRoot194]|uniref:hypothetical protein n=1 Tax=Acidovorax sp. LjRoot194 TaxID=3342280 RepID=UPI003ECFFF74